MSQLAYARAVQRYTAARNEYRRYSNKNRPPEVAARYEQAKRALEREKLQSWPPPLGHFP